MICPQLLFIHVCFKEFKNCVKQQMSGWQRASDRWDKPEIRKKAPKTVGANYTVYFPGTRCSCQLHRSSCLVANGFLCSQFCLCLTEAILIFAPEGSLFFCSHKVKVQLHWTAQMLSLVAATLGLGFIISSKNRSELPHFISWHSILGLLTFLATCGQVLCGLCLLFPQLLRISLMAQLQRCHTMCGLMVYLLATFTVVLGICSDWFQAQIKGVVWYLCLGLIFFPALVIVNQISRTCLSKKRQYV
ncbi:cytochrome b561 domain-containing protein 1 isoform X1 [Python bivittatus]|uniref:ascorbate ferrireductase (transmembrane) n=1 Tax=Python bivittatus TaxID=176946 RepID=A0A9F5MSA9_PYTBI|nr:cytochrome b561 domain-containing protein 1 isoform X1 [Python bivittatus]